MRLDDLDLRELLDYRPEGGLIHFAGRRVVLLDVVALGLLRRELVDRLGIGGARGILTRMGYAHGWRIAEESRALPWDEPDAWRRADWSASDAALLAAPSRSPAPSTPSMPSATVSVSSRSDAPSASSPGGSSSTVGVLAAASNTARIKPPLSSI